MSERDDDLEFDFFDDEPATQEATVRRPPVRPRGGDDDGGGGGGGGPRRPQFGMRTPQGITPLLRLIGLIAFAILIVVLLVFWVQSCRGASKRNAYETYMEDVGAVATGSAQIGRELNTLLTTPGLRENDLESRLRGLAQREEQYVTQAQGIDPPGRMRPFHENVVEALQFRVSGLRGLEGAFRETARTTRDAGAAGTLLAAQAQRLVASDVIWDDLFKDPAKAELEAQGLGGIEPPDSNFLENATLADARSMTSVWQRLRGASTGGGTVSGAHGNGIQSTKALPSNQELSEDEENTVVAGTELAFEVAVENSGDFQEVSVAVTLTIQQSPQPIVKRSKIDLINPGETQSVTFRNLGNVQFATRTQVKVDVQPVPGEKNVANNSASYPVIFSLQP
jgi:hypothetical protein